MHPAYIENSLTYLKQSTIDARKDGWPMVINVEPTDACNLQCKYCPPKQRPKSIMSLPMFKAILDQLPAGRLTLNLHKDGEPTLHSWLNRMVDMAHESKKFELIHFNTNGIIYADVKNCDITVSIDAARRQTYIDNKGGDKLEQVEANAKRYAQRNHVRVKCIDSVGPLEVEEFKEKWKGFEVQIHPEHQWLEGPEIQPDRKPCRLLRQSLAVNANGLVSVCNFDHNHTGIVGDYTDLKKAFLASEQHYQEQRRGRWRPVCCVTCQMWRCEG